MLSQQGTMLVEPIRLLKHSLECMEDLLSIPHLAILPCNSNLLMVNRCITKELPAPLSAFLDLLSGNTLLNCLMFPSK